MLALPACIAERRRRLTGLRAAEQVLLADCPRAHPRVRIIPASAHRQTAAMASRVGRLLALRLASNAAASTAPAADRITQVACSRVFGLTQTVPMPSAVSSARRAFGTETRALWGATRSFHTGPFSASAAEAAAAQPAAPSVVEPVLKMREVVPSDQGKQASPPTNPTRRRPARNPLAIPHYLHCLSCSGDALAAC